MKKLLILHLALVILTILAMSSCRKGNDDWYDSGAEYLCSECKDIYASELAPCENCNTNDTPYRLCYDCAKKLNQCQNCRKSR